VCDIPEMIMVHGNHKRHTKNCVRTFFKVIKNLDNCNVQFTHFDADKSKNLAPLPPPLDLLIRTRNFSLASLISHQQPGPADNSSTVSSTKVLINKLPQLRKHATSIMTPNHVALPSLREINHGRYSEMFVKIDIMATVRPARVGRYMLLLASERC
jgi:hypothetical protein